MNIDCVIFDNHHPKHYLTVRQLSEKCESEGVDVVWSARDKDVLLDLMRADGIEPHVHTVAQKGALPLLLELIRYDIALWRLARRFRPQALLGKNISVSHIGCLTGVPSIVINDDDAKANPQYPKLAYPFATRIVTPDFLKEDYGDKQSTYSGLCELAYLGPRVFKPDEGVRAQLGLDPGESYFLVRSVAFNASHDWHARGLSEELIRELISRLQPYGKVFISAEGNLNAAFSSFQIPLSPARLHHALAFADLLVCDSQSMAAEAAVLGCPSLRITSFHNKLRYLAILEERFGLTYSFAPNAGSDLLGCVEQLLSKSDLKQEWKHRRDNMLMYWSDPTDVFWEQLRLVLGRSVK